MRNLLLPLGLTPLLTHAEAATPVYPSTPTMEMGGVPHISGGNLMDIAKATRDSATYFIRDEKVLCGDLAFVQKTLDAGGYGTYRAGAEWCAGWSVDLLPVRLDDQEFVFKDAPLEGGNPPKCYATFSYAAAVLVPDESTGAIQTVILLQDDQKPGSAVRRLEECPSEKVSVAEIVEPLPVQEPREPHSFHFPQLPVKAVFPVGIGAGVEQESFSSYAEGLIDDAPTPRPALSLHAEWAPAGADKGLRVGLDTDFAFAAGGSGWEKSGGHVGYKAGPVLVSAGAGWTGEPAARGTNIDGTPYLDVEVAYDVPTWKLPGQGKLVLNVGDDLIRLPYMEPDLNAALKFAWEFPVTLSPTNKLDVGMLVPAEKPALQGAAPKIVTSEHVFDLKVSLSTPSNTVALVDQGQAESYRSDLKSYAARSNWKAAADRFQKLLVLRDTKGVTLQYDDYRLGRDAARGVLDTLTAYHCLQWMAQIGNKPEDLAELETFEKSWAYVSIKVDAHYKGARTLDMSMPFDPITWQTMQGCRADFEAKGEYTGFLPLKDLENPIEYKVGGVSFVPKPLSEDPNEQIFILQ